MDHKSTRNVADELTEQEHKISHATVAKLLKATRYSLQATRKKLEGAQHPDRDARFQHINPLATRFMATGAPVISVDTKERAGRTVHPARLGAATHAM